MSQDKIEKVMNLAFCTEEEARVALHETDGDVVDAIDILLKVPQTLAAPKQKKMDDIQQFFTKLRHDTQKMNDEIEESLKIKNLTSSNQRDSLQSVDLPSLHEETVQQSNYSQECQLPSLESAVQKQETAYPSLSECSYDLQSSVQKSHGSGHQSPLSNLDQERESWQKGVQTPV